MRQLLAALAVAACSGCAALPSLEGRPQRPAPPDTSRTKLAAAIEPLAREHPGRTGIFPLPLALDAFAARMVLARAAEKSLDAQYYIWHDDQTGLLMLDAMRDAALRGVHVRLLIDDQNTKGFDALLATVARVPNVEVRLYNPFANRRARFLDYLGDFGRVNRRMHNKSFTVDGHATVVGGRNIGNEYFGAGHEIPFKDLDVVAIGRAVQDVSAQFDLYWNSASAYPVATLVPEGEARPDELGRRLAQAREDPLSSDYLGAVRDSPLLQELLKGRLPYVWADAAIVRDDPRKTLDAAPERGMLALAQVLEVTGPPAKSFDVISPYFVPGDNGTEALAGLAKRGVQVRVLTNSLASTDVAIVHSGYAKRRCELARAGVRLYELKPRVTPRDAPKTKASTTGSSAARLHAKTFALDGEYVFVGSFNFDPRSALLNTEMGLVIHSPLLAHRLSAAFDGVIAENSYAVRPRGEGEGECIEWVERSPEGEKVLDTEPDSGALRRLWLAVLMALPIDWLL